MPRSTAVGTKPPQTTPLLSEKTQKYVVRGIITLLALAAIGGAIYGGINLGTHNFTHLSEVGLWAVTGASSFVTLCLFIGVAIHYKRTNPASKAAASGPQAAASRTAVSSTHKNSLSQPVEKSSSRELSYLELVDLLPLLDDNEYIFDTTISGNYYFRFKGGWKLHMHENGLMGSTDLEPKPRNIPDDHQMQGQTPTQVKLMLAPHYTHVQPQVLLTRLSDARRLASLPLSVQISLTSLEYEPIEFAAAENLIPCLDLPENQFSVLLVGNGHGLSEFHILKNVQGKTQRTLGLPAHYGELDASHNEQLETHCRGMTFMTQRALLRTYRSERV